MSVEFWAGAERFYEFWLVILGIILGLIIIVMMIIIMNTKKDNTKKVILTFLLGGIGVIIAGILGHIYYQPYLEQARYVNPLVRDRVPRFIGYNYYGRSEQNYYSQLHDLESLREFDIYEEEIVSEPIVYLGEGTNSHYFEHSNGDLFRHTMNLEFKEGIEQSRIVGSRFHLKDDSFESIGFKNPQNIMFDYIEIPASEKGKKYTPENERQFLRMEKVIKGWNF